MKYTLATALALVYAQSVFGLTVNTPTGVVQCQPIMLTWKDGTGPYFLSIIPGGQPTAAPLKTFDKTDATSLTWPVDIRAGTKITVMLKDNTGAQAFSDAVDIQPSNDSSCLNDSAAPAPNAAPAAAAPDTTAANGTPPAASGATAATSGSSSAASGSPAAAAPPAQRPAGTTRAAAVSASATAANGAVRSTFTYGLAGVLAAVGAALF